jgi:hypothetical protein
VKRSRIDIREHPMIVDRLREAQPRANPAIATAGDIGHQASTDASGEAEMFDPRRIKPT